MRVIIAGSRSINDAGRLNRAIRSARFDITTVVSGMCPDSPDMLGVAWAKLQDPKVAVHPMPADWETHGKRAGMIRNCEMAKEAGALIALWDGKSSGTRHMITEAVSKGLHHYIDATCAGCGGNETVAIYRLVRDGKTELRARCRQCIIAAGGDITWFDMFKAWDNHTLHVIEKRLKIPETDTPPPPPPNTEVPFKLVFGEKYKAVQEFKKMRELPPERPASWF